MSNRIALMCVALSLAMSTALFAQEAKDGHGKPEPPMAGVHWAKGQGPKNAGSLHNSPLMTNHGGDIMTSVQPVQAIFWGPGWSSAAFAGDKITGMETFYSGVGNTGYAHTCSEYSDPFRDLLGDSITYNGKFVDTTPASNGQSANSILAEVCKVITNPWPNGYYPVYVDIPRGHAGFCAWHSAGSCGGVPVQFAFFFNLDGDPGCDPEDTSGQHSQGLAALANVSGHELSETRTDPRLNAWFDNTGAENGDKCAWTFGTPLLTSRNSSQWKIQGNWSNKAYTNSTGYPNATGQRGCIDGGNNQN
jgi:hypothetical protein